MSETEIFTCIPKSPINIEKGKKGKTKENIKFVGVTNPTIYNRYRFKTKKYRFRNNNSKNSGNSRRDITKRNQKVVKNGDLYRHDHPRCLVGTPWSEINGDGGNVSSSERK